MIILIDCNSDTLRIKDGTNNVEFKIINPINMISILSEIFNRLNCPGIILERISEDNHTIVEEW